MEKRNYQPIKSLEKTLCRGLAFASLLIPSTTLISCISFRDCSGTYTETYEKGVNPDSYVDQMFSVNIQNLPSLEPWQELANETNQTIGLDINRKPDGKADIIIHPKKD
jgi:hypothetical protein